MQISEEKGIIEIFNHEYNMRTKEDIITYLQEGISEYKNKDKDKYRSKNFYLKYSEYLEEFKNQIEFNKNGKDRLLPPIHEFNFWHFEVVCTESFIKLMIVYRKPNYEFMKSKKVNDLKSYEGLRPYEKMSCFEIQEYYNIMVYNIPEFTVKEYVKNIDNSVSEEILRQRIRRGKMRGIKKINGEYMLTKLSEYCSKGHDEYKFIINADQAERSEKRDDAIIKVNNEEIDLLDYTRLIIKKIDKNNYSFDFGIPNNTEYKTIENITKSDAEKIVSVLFVKPFMEEVYGEFSSYAW